MDGYAAFRPRSAGHLRPRQVGLTLPDYATISCRITSRCCGRPRVANGILFYPSGCRRVALAATERHPLCNPRQTGPAGKDQCLACRAHPPSAQRRRWSFGLLANALGLRRQATHLAFAPVGPLASAGPAGGVVGCITSRCCGRVRTRPMFLVVSRPSARALPATERQSLCGQVGAMTPRQVRLLATTLHIVFSVVAAPLVILLTVVMSVGAVWLWSLYGVRLLRWRFFNGPKPQPLPTSAADRKAT